MELNVQVVLVGSGLPVILKLNKYSNLFLGSFFTRKFQD